MSWIATILSFLGSEALSIWSKVSGTLTTIVNELADDEVAILHGAMVLAANDLQNGKDAETTFTDTLNYVAAQEKGELSKVGQALLQAFISATAAKQAGG